MSVSDMRDSFGREGRAFFQLTVLFSPDIASLIRATIATMGRFSEGQFGARIRATRGLIHPMR
jgi:hypothetical protein